jgi:predicted esterase
MTKVMQQGTLVLIISLLLFSCKKDAAPLRPAPGPVPLPVNDVVETAPHILTPISKKINNVIHGLYEALPANYSKTTKNYPLIIFVPGAGQVGTTHVELNYLLHDGLAKLIAEKKFPPNFVVNGKNYSFIVLTPQLSHVPTSQEMLSFLEFAKANYRVDVSRIYFSGLSMGGMVASDVGAEYTSQIAAIAPIAGVFYEGVTAKSEKIAKGKLPVWAFHNTNDTEISVQVPLYFISEINSFKPAIPPRLTLFSGIGHNAWEPALDPNYKEDGKNVYEWMLGYSR